MSQYHSISDFETSYNKHGHTVSVNGNHVQREYITPQSKKRKVLTYMIGNLLAGVIVAIVQDRLYAHYHHRTVESQEQQRYFHWAGNALAFLTKLLFALAVSIAYIQCFWLATSKSSTTLKDIDAMTSVLYDVFHFRRVRIWFKHFALFLLALTVWCLPLSAVFTPGAFIVEPTTLYATGSQTPPQAQQNFIAPAQNFAEVRLDETAVACDKNPDGTRGICYSDVIFYSSSSELMRIAQITAALSEIVMPSPASPRMNYSISFYGPSLSCSAASDDDKATFNESLTNAYENKYLWRQRTLADWGSGTLLYNSWREGNFTEPNWNNGTVPFGLNNMTVYMQSASPQEKFSMALVSCNLYNYSYTVDYYYNDTVKNASITQMTKLNLVPFIERTDVDNPDWTNTVYNSILYVFNQLMLGTVMDFKKDNYPSRQGGTSILFVLQEFFDKPETATADALIDRLETLSRNITVGTIASTALAANSSQLRQVEVRTWENLQWYKYTPWVLYASYGTAGLASLIGVLFGVAAVQRGASGLGIDFSTIVATMSGAVRDMPDADAKSLKKTRVILRGRNFTFAEGGRTTGADVYAMR